MSKLLLWASGLRTTVLRCTQLVLGQWVLI